MTNNAENKPNKLYPFEFFEYPYYYSSVLITPFSSDFGHVATTEIIDFFH